MSENYKTERNFILRLKQNTNIITSGLEDAKIALKTQMRTLEDKGQLIVCFYKGSEDDTTVRVIGGITGSETLFVNDYEVTKDLTDAINALKGGVSVDFDTLKKIEDYINDLNFTSPDADAVNGQYISEFKQENGLIKGLNRVNLSDAPINGYIKGTRMPDDDLSIKSTDDFKTGFSKLEKQVDKHTEDVNKRFVDLKYDKYTRKGTTIINTVTQKDGLINVTEEELKAETVTTPNITGTDSTIEVEGDTVKDQIANIAAHIKSNENNTLHYRLVKLTKDEIDKLVDGANVFEAYKLMYWPDSDGQIDAEPLPLSANQTGEIIKIYKDKNLEKVELVEDGQGLKFTYNQADGTSKDVTVDFKAIAFNADFKDGLTVNANGEVRVLIDSSSESFLTVSGTGVKLSGIQNAINAAKTEVNTALNAEIAARKAVDGQAGQTYTANTSTTYIKNAASLNDADVKLDSAIKAVNDRIDGLDRPSSPVSSNSGHVTIDLVQTDGKVTSISVSDSDIASANDLTALTERVAAIEEWNVIDGGTF